MSQHSFTCVLNYNSTEQNNHRWWKLPTRIVPESRNTVIPGNHMLGYSELNLYWLHLISKRRITPFNAMHLLITVSCPLPGWRILFIVIVLSWTFAVWADPRVLIGVGPWMVFSAFHAERIIRVHDVSNTWSIRKYPSEYDDTSSIRDILRSHTMGNSISSITLHHEQTASLQWNGMNWFSRTNWIEGELTAKW